MKVSLRSTVLAASGAVAVAAGTAAWAHQAARPAARLFVVNQDSGTVTPVRLPGDVAEAAVRVGRHPAAIVAAPDGRTVYVANGASGTVTPITVASGRPGRPIRVGADPVALAVSRDGQTLYVVDNPGLVTSARGPGTVVPVQIPAGRVGRPIRVGSSPVAMVLIPGGRTALVLNKETVDGHSFVMPVNLRTDKPGKRIPLPSTPNAIAVAPGGRMAYVAGAGRMVATASGEMWQGVLTPIRLRGMVRGKPIVVGQDPFMGNEAPDQVLFSPRGDIAYVVYPGLGAIVPVRTALGRAGKPVQVGDYADAAALTRSGRRLYVQTNEGVTELNTVTRATRHIRTGSSQQGCVAISSDGRTVFALGELENGKGIVTPIAVGANRTRRPIIVGGNPVAMLIVP